MRNKTMKSFFVGGTIGVISSLIFTYTWCYTNLTMGLCLGLGLMFLMSFVASKFLLKEDKLEEKSTVSIKK